MFPLVQLNASTLLTRFIEVCQTVSAIGEVKRIREGFEITAHPLVLIFLKSKSHLHLYGYTRTMAIFGNDCSSPLVCISLHW